MLVVPHREQLAEALRDAAQEAEAEELTSDDSDEAVSDADHQDFRGLAGGDTASLQPVRRRSFLEALMEG
ncbi:hypothetical protein GDO78_014356 [Eleutherodactylus coqui]|uniref:Uncharacterized protein n=1 Tax=Eleutherodactylus coqui TaxID=57060 RepID=A0A8J6BFM0_ELECQ|nr:hypothetical protein GDO78_014356 [Eleutherodactylus coqui]